MPVADGAGAAWFWAWRGLPVFTSLEPSVLASLKPVLLVFRLPLAASRLVWLLFRLPLPLRDCFCLAGSIFSTGASAAEVATDAAAFLPFLRDWGFAAAAFSPAAGLALLCAAFRLPESSAVACFLPLRDELGLAACLAWFAFASAVFAWFVLASLKPASLVFASLAPSVLASLKLALLVFRLPLALRDFLPALPFSGCHYRSPLVFSLCAMSAIRRPTPALNQSCWYPNRRAPLSPPRDRPF